MNGIKQIVVHQNPHLDELVAVWLLRNYGEQKFPGIKDAKLIAWGKNDLAETSPEMAAMSGILLVGLGAGMFDDHVNGRRQDCASTLVAKHLGVANDPSLKRLLLEVFRADASAEGPFQAIAEEVKNLNRYWAGSLDLEKLYLQVVPLILIRVARQREYLEAVARFEKAYHRRINGVLLAAVSEFDNYQFQHACRSRGAQIIVQRNKAGLTQIFGNEDLDMQGLALRVRKAEIVKGRMHLSRFHNDEELSVTGTMREIPQWYFEDGLLLNGSESFTDVPPSKIDFRELVYLVEKHLTELTSKAASEKIDEALVTESAVA